MTSLDWIIAQLADAWGINPASIEPHMMFEEFGMDDGDLVPLVVDLQRAFGCRLTDEALSASATIEDLAREVEAVANPSRTALDDGYPSPAQLGSARSAPGNHPGPVSAVAASDGGGGEPDTQEAPHVVAAGRAA